MPNPDDIALEDVPPIKRHEIASTYVRISPWTVSESDYLLRFASDLWANMTPRQRRKLARVDVGVYAVVKAIAETRKGL